MLSEIPIFVKISYDKFHKGINQPSTCEKITCTTKSLWCMTYSIRSMSICHALKMNLNRRQNTVKYCWEKSVDI